MARLKLVYNPSTVLRAPNFDLEFPLSRDTKELIDQMIFACKRFRGIGLAAPQVGKNLNLAIINLEEYDVAPFAIINPKIATSSFKSNIMEEGCLSIPGTFGMVKRPEKLSVKFYTQNGKLTKLSMDGLLAKVFQHEIDHLGGILIADKWDVKTVHHIKQEELDKARRKRMRERKQSHGA